MEMGEMQGLGSPVTKGVGYSALWLAEFLNWGLSHPGL